LVGTMTALIRLENTAHFMMYTNGIETHKYCLFTGIKFNTTCVGIFVMIRMSLNFIIGYV